VVEEPYAQVRDGFVLLVTEAWAATDLSASYHRRQVRRARRKIHHIVIIM
jgi:hypothetical protein